MHGSPVVILHLHRGYFSQAMIDHPVEPLKSRYAQSVLAALRAALHISASIRALYTENAQALRYWLFGSTWFSACVRLRFIESDGRLTSAH
jgi:hypothetical protein